MSLEHLLSLTDQDNSNGISNLINSNAELKYFLAFLRSHYKPPKEAAAIKKRYLYDYLKNEELQIPHHVAITGKGCIDRLKHYNISTARIKLLKWVKIKELKEKEEVTFSKISLLRKHNSMTFDRINELKVIHMYYDSLLLYQRDMPDCLLDLSEVINMHCKSEQGRSEEIESLSKKSFLECESWFNLNESKLSACSQSEYDLLLQSLNELTLKSLEEVKLFHGVRPKSIYPEANKYKGVDGTSFRVYVDEFISSVKWIYPILRKGIEVTERKSSLVYLFKDLERKVLADLNFKQGFKLNTSQNRNNKMRSNKDQIAIQTICYKWGVNISHYNFESKLKQVREIMEALKNKLLLLSVDSDRGTHEEEAIIQLESILTEFETLNNFSLNICKSIKDTEKMVIKLFSSESLSSVKILNKTLKSWNNELQSLYADLFLFIMEDSPARD